MKTRNLTAKALVIAATAAGFASHAAHAQNMWAANAAFDQQFNQRLAAMQQQNANAQQQLWQRHLQVNGPRLQAQYRQYLASGQRAMNFQQFAYWDLMTAAGTNVQGALNAQRAQFEGNQRANATVQSGHASYNAGWAANQQRQSAALSRYSNEGIRGYAPYVDRHTGATTQLPYYLPPGQHYTYNGTTYAQDQQGTYYRYDGNAWTRLQSGR
ncbi:MAG: hypothetical protein KAX84_13165 [Burkholderiales bacterium]|nr:hypothetical protein [Burkholderiales bacterium]